ncbi:MAG: hypothetical protein WBK08_16875 [Nitrospira sp.]
MRKALCTDEGSPEHYCDLQGHFLSAEQTKLERGAIRMGYGTEDRKKAVVSFQADHQRHTEMVHRTFQSLFAEPKTSPLFKATLRLIGASK